MLTVLLHCPVSDAYTGLFSAQIGLVINQKNFVIVLINVIIIPVYLLWPCSLFLMLICLQVENLFEKHLYGN